MTVGAPTLLQLALAEIRILWMTIAKIWPILSKKKKDILLNSLKDIGFKIASGKRGILCNVLIQVR